MGAAVFNPQRPYHFWAGNDIDQGCRGKVVPVMISS